MKPNIQTPASHRDDPDTSYMAEKKITKSGKRTAQQEQVLKCVQTFPGRTSAELAELSGLDRAMIARRLPELCPQFVIKGEKTTCTACRSECVTWYPRFKGQMKEQESLL